MTDLISENSVTTPGTIRIMYLLNFVFMDIISAFMLVHDYV
jgi:hypothetical protein